MTEPGIPRTRRKEPVVITNLANSRTAEIRDRERRYVYAMLFRALCFILATVLFSGVARWIAVAVAVFMPWLAVVLANAPKVRHVKHAAYVPPAPREVPSLAPGRPHQVIDPD